MDSFDLTAGVDPRHDAHRDREWLAVNYLGGYASSTVTGLNTRKYHGLLVAAMSPPVNRMVLLSRVEESIICDGWTCPLACSEYPGAIYPRGDQSLRAFSANPFPRWAYQGIGWTIEKSLRLIRGSNTVVLSYTLLGGDCPVEMHLRPMLALRSIHELMYQWNGSHNVETKGDGTHRVAATARTPEVFFAHTGVFENEPLWYLNTIYRRETERGYCGLEDVWAPGIVRWSLQPGQTAFFVCSADPIDLRATLADVARETLVAMLPSPPATSWGEPIDSLRRAADQFVLHVPVDQTSQPPVQRDYIAADYPWSPPSPRQSLIAFEGLLLSTGKRDAALSLLLSLADRLVNGVLPSSFDEHDGRPRYDGADVSLWFVNAVGLLIADALPPLSVHRERGQQVDIDLMAAQPLFIAVRDIIEAYRAGLFRLKISIDSDGLLSAGDGSMAVTWMNAKLDGKPVTPRAGKAVELQALWYNALRVGATLAERFGWPECVGPWESLARSVKRAFNERFWNAEAGCCFDVVDVSGAPVNDASIRPNQLLAAALPHAVLIDDRYPAVLDVLRTQLLTPVGLRSLSPNNRRYIGTYRGNVVARDRARHNGCVFAWLLGPYVRLFLTVHGKSDRSRRQAQELLQGCVTHLLGAGQGQLPEMFEGDRPAQRRRRDRLRHIGGAGAGGVDGNVRGDGQRCCTRVDLVTNNFNDDLNRAIA